MATSMELPRNYNSTVSPKPENRRPTVSRQKPARTGANGAKVADLCVAQGIPQAAISSYTFPTTATGQLVPPSRPTRDFYTKCK